MGPTTNQIERHIEETREDLASNLQELEHKVKSVTDWRHQFRRYPMAMMGAAFGGGLLLGVWFKGGKHDERRIPRPRPH